MERNYNTISPSARMLLLMKGLTNIPFARRAAELIMLPNVYAPDYSSKEPTFWGKVVHFENRYWSIDQLLRDLPITNILELSAGFSFRGLQSVIDKPIHYIDTDLPDLIATKQQLLAVLKEGVPHTKGVLETMPLNALDEAQFKAVTDRFPPGPVVVVNEGLLMYLGPEEKATICGFIHKLLEERGGYWITADAYVRNKKVEMGDDAAGTFFKEHRIEENKFDSFEDAEAFFNSVGFVIDKEAERDHARISTLPYLTASVPPEKLAEMRSRGAIQKTWRLKVK
jgi:O-methyltransferase involved in polyketide biosynthesis